MGVAYSALSYKAKEFSVLVELTEVGCWVERGMCDRVVPTIPFFGLVFPIEFPYDSMARDTLKGVWRSFLGGFLSD